MKNATENLVRSIFNNAMTKYFDTKLNDDILGFAEVDIIDNKLRKFSSKPLVNYNTSEKYNKKFSGEFESIIRTLTKDIFHTNQDK